MKTIFRLLSVALAGTLLAGSAAAAAAEPYPSKPIRFLVPYPPGGASDVTARVIGQKLAESLGQPVVVENKPGANGTIASDQAAKSAPDGYTILMGNVGPNAISASLYRKLPYDVVKDFAPVTLTTVVPIVLVAGPSVPAKDFKEFVALVKSKPGKITFASAGNGSSNHLTGELLKSMAGLDMVHVPYKGDSPAMTDIMGGQVDVMFTTVIAALPHIKSGKLKPLALATAKRTAALPDVPTIAESGVAGFDASSWGGILAPAATPKEIVAKLHAEIVKIMKLPDVNERLSGLGAEIVGNTPEEFGAFIKSETAKWGKVVKASGATLD